MFTPVHLHLLGNHVPILLSVIAFVILLAAAMKRRNDWTRFGLVFALVAGVAAVPTFFSGSSSEELVEDLPGVSGAVIEPHEDAGKFAAIAAGAVGVMSAGVLLAFRRGRELPGLVRPLSLMGIALVAGLMGWTGYLGGQIRHTEVRPGATSTLSAPEKGERGDERER